MLIANFKTDKYLNNFQEHLFGILKCHLKISFARENKAIKHDLVEFKVQSLKAFGYHGNKSTILLFYSIFRTTHEVSSELKYIRSQRKYGFLNTKELIFEFQSLDLKFHFSAEND